MRKGKYRLIKLFKDLTSMLIYILALAGKKSNNNSKEINKKKYINLIWDSKLGEEKIKVHSRKPISVAWEVLIHEKLLTLTFN